MLKKSTIKCIICGAGESQEVQIGIRYAPHTVVRRCIGCLLVSLWPVPSEEELASYYAKDYRAEYHGTIAPENTYEKGVEEARERVKRLLSWMTPAMELLEVGAGAGQFLDAVRSHVRSAIGVEPDEAHRRWACSAKGLDIYPSLTDVRGRRFDLIALFHTLEHVLDPIGFLRELAGYLAPGGRIVLEVPNVNDALLALYKLPAFATFYYQRAHLYYFSPHTLEQAVQAAGGRAVITGIQRYDLSNHLRWMITGQPGGQGYYREVLTGVVQEAYAEALIRAGYADTLWAVATFEAGDARQ